MFGRIGQRDRRLLGLLFKVRKAKRDAAENLAIAAADLMGVTPSEWATLYSDGDRDAQVALRSAASEDDGWMEHFDPGDGERDWEGFFAGLVKCMEQFMPLIISFM